MMWKSVLLFPESVIVQNYEKIGYNQMSDGKMLVTTHPVIGFLLLDLIEAEVVNLEPCGRWCSVGCHTNLH